MSSESIRVRIFDQDYHLRCDDADADTLRQVTYYVNSKIAELQKQNASKNNEKIAVLTALSIAGELFETKEMYEAEMKKKRECEEKIKSITDKIGGVKNSG